MKKILKIVVHIFGISVVLLFSYQVAAAFLYAPGLLGGDTEQFLYYVSEFSKRFVLPPAGWKMTWYEGTPQMLDNPWLNFNLIQIIVQFFDTLMATKIFLILFIFLFILFSYLVFWELSGSIFLSTALSLAVARSWSIYVQLFSSGVALSSNAQITFPATLFFLLRYVKTADYKWLALSVLAVAYGFYTHSFLTIFVIFPACLIFLFFALISERSIINTQKVKVLLIFGLTSFLLSLPALMPQLIDFFSGGIVRQASFANLSTQNQPPFWPIIKMTNITLFIFLPIALIISVFGKLRQKFKLLLPLMAILAFFVLFQVSFLLKVNPLVGVLFPHRFYWLLTIVVASLIAYLLGVEDKKSISQKATIYILSVVIIIFSLSFKLEAYDIDQVNNFAPTVFQIIERGLPKYQLNNLFIKTEVLEEKVKLSGPIDSKDINHRLYAFNMPIRLLWNIFYPMPQIQGYFHYRTSNAGNWFAWLTAVFSKENYDSGGIPTDIAQKQSLFLADWYAVRYIQSEDSKEGKIAPHFYSEGTDYVNYRSALQDPALIELSESYISPIAKPVNQSIIGFVGDRQSYDYFVRNLGIMNLNSNYVVPIRLANYIEDLDPNILNYFNGLIIYNFRKKNTSENYQAGWQKLRLFVENGGLVFVETGAETPEKWGEAIPELYPVNQLLTGSLGNNWNVQSTFFSPQILSNLAPLTYEGGDWTLSYAPTSALKQDSKSLLDQNDKVIIAVRQIGQGKVVWSGLNIFYRPLYHKTQALTEAELFKEILINSALITYQHLDFDFNRQTPEKVKLSFSGGKGALLKENNYGGWSAYASSGDNKIKLPILSAGPDFMYAPLPNNLVGKPVKIEFVYRGLWYYWLFCVLALITFIFLLDIICFKQKIFRFFFKPLFVKISSVKKDLYSDWNEDQT